MVLFQCLLLYFAGYLQVLLLVLAAHHFPLVDHIPPLEVGLRSATKKQQQLKTATSLSKKKCIEKIPFGGYRYFLEQHIVKITTAIVIRKRRLVLIKSH